MLVPQPLLDEVYAALSTAGNTGLVQRLRQLQERLNNIPG